MLVLTRKTEESIIIDGNIRITIVAVKGDRVRIGISAPPSVRIDRQEVHERRVDLPFCAASAECQEVKPCLA